MIVVLGLSLLGMAWGDNFRFGDIKWASCYRGEGDFYDPRFPEVCADRSSRLRVGFTITGAWTWANTGTSMLQFAAEDKLAYESSPDKMCGDPVRGCKLRLDRNTASPTNERRIGYRTGLSDSSGNDRTIPSLAANAIVGCPIFGGGPALCPNQATSYDFSITRESPDRTIVFARYSFEILFPSEDDYTVFFEGCCRVPSTVGVEYTINNPSLTFHLRTGVSVSLLRTPSLPVKSFRWTMPDVISLRYLGIRGDNSQCGDPQCGAVSECALKFQLQGYHPQSEFASSVRFRIGNTLEQGKYKCVEHSPLNAPVPQIPNSFVVNNRCPTSMTDQIRTGTEIFSAPFNVGSQDLSVEAATGIVTFSVRSPGMYQLTVMADVTANGKVLSTPVDMLVSVAETPGNGNPPKLYTLPDAEKGFLNIVPKTTRASPITVACGRDTWSMSTYNHKRLRVGFKDDDTIGCTNMPQFIDFITQSHDLPKGVQFSLAAAPAGNFTRLASTSSSTPVQYGLAYLDIFWRPQCEDLSQIGLFQWCFKARDGYSGAGFKFLNSAPSQVSPAGIIDSSCIYVNAQGPPAENPAPTLQAPTQFTTCNSGCCPCCGETGCLCDTGSNCYICDGAYAEAKTSFSYTIHATDTDPSTKVNFRMTFPVGGFENYISLADLEATLAGEGVSMPTLATTTKYGCGDVEYDECISNPSMTSDATTKIQWTLPPDRDVISIRAFKVCYQAVEEVSPYVDVQLWNKTYGRLPNSDSCQVCFMLNVANQPRWMDQFGVIDKPVCESGQVSNFVFAVGQTVGNTIRLEAEDTAPNQQIEIAVLADPGAPNGAVLGPMQQLLDSAGSISNRQYGRTFTFSPELSQVGIDFPACFQATNINGLSSKTCCTNLQVLRGDPFWSLSKQWDYKQGCWTACPWSSTATDQCLAVDEASACPPEAVIDVTVGCNYKTSVSLLLNNAPYNPRLRIQQLPSCDNCVPGGISVEACHGGNNGTACCGNNRCDGAETGSNCPSDCPPDMATLEDHPDYPSNPNWQIFTYTPSRAQQGRTVLTCIEVYDVDYGTAVISQERQGSKAPSMCMVFNVQSCRYCVPQGATLRSIAKHYLLNVDWLRLYNSNPDIPNPNMRKTSPSPHTRNHAAQRHSPCTTICVEILITWAPDWRIVLMRLVSGSL